MISKNVGNIDRVIRLVAGAALGYASYTTGGPAAIILGIAAALAVITGLVGYCGLYALLGINTCGVNDKP
ncbi:MAG: YgaP family membrane protein [Elusimicrobiales bacterium]